MFHLCGRTEIFVLLNTQKIKETERSVNMKYNFRLEEFSEYFVSSGLRKSRLQNSERPVGCVSKF